MFAMADRRFRFLHAYENNPFLIRKNDHGRDEFHENNNNNKSNNNLRITK